MTDVCDVEVATRRIVGGSDSPPELESPCQVNTVSMFVVVNELFFINKVRQSQKFLIFFIITRMIFVLFQIKECSMAFTFSVCIFNGSWS